MAYATIRTEIDDGILRLTLNRPEKLNAFTVEMCEELIDAYRSASRDDAVQAIVVTGEGKAFCAGMDLSVDGNVFGLDETISAPSLAGLRDGRDDPALLHGVRDTGGRVALAMLDCLKPIVGAVNGVAVGIGSTMLLSMDFRFAAEDARFGFVFGRLGITPEACSTWLLPRIVGIEQALLWCYRGDVFDATDALAAGLVRGLFPRETVVEQAVAFARSLVAGKSAVATALTRQMLLRNPALPSPFDAHLVESLAVFRAQNGDGGEGVRAFREKRAARFTARASAMPPFYPWTDGS
jgi:enoyl-CoA hydratase/carnithine racemase